MCFSLSLENICFFFLFSFIHKGCVSLINRYLQFQMCCCWKWSLESGVKDTFEKHFIQENEHLPSKFLYMLKADSPEESTAVEMQETEEWSGSVWVDQRGKATVLFRTSSAGSEPTNCCLNTAVPVLQLTTVSTSTCLCWDPCNKSILHLIFLFIQHQSMKPEIQKFHDII
ncbi:hypothetical protein Q8A67_004250 [Cirrhinus molitorella]|uniref:Uncharacterized protein n=1 Tax=Cirrhinus molitorella TaxID=172907 RepID=A0AA88QAG2_9TELE|nr:hypothetical protein Q8A67_004250 [Cirrhinus molitorella]